MTIQLPFLYDYVMPNFILPNATPTEQTIINYMYTQHSNDLRNESFFDQHIEKENSPMKAVFGDSIGEWPNSMGMGGSYLKMPCYKTCVQINEASVYFGKKNGIEKYIYPIKVTLHFGKFTGTDHTGGKSSGEYFWKHISAETLYDLRDRRAIVFLEWANENAVWREQYEDLHRNIALSGIPKEQIILTVNSFNAKEIYESWFPHEERQLEVHNLPFLLSNISYHYYSNQQTIVSEETFNNSRTVLRKNHFLYKIRRNKDYRIALLQKLASDGLLERGDWSCLSKIPLASGLQMTSQFNLGLNNDAVVELHAKLPHVLQNEPETTFHNTHGWGDKNSNANANAYLYIASETFITGEYKSLTEKVFKPLINYQPFVFVAWKGALNELRKLGFKTFSPMIDENYDDEPDPIRRLQLVYGEINRICSMDKAQIHAWYWTMEDIYKHNRAHLMNMFDNEPHTIALIKYLSDRIAQ